MTGPKTNERPRHAAPRRATSACRPTRPARCSTSSAASTSPRPTRCSQFCERDASIPIRKCLASAVANAEHNDSQLPDELYVSACYADEGPTLKRWRPRARGRATRIRKRTCHITVIVSRMPEELLEQQRARDEAKPSHRAARRSGQQAQAARRERVARSRAAAAAAEDHEAPRSRPRRARPSTKSTTTLTDVVEPDMVEVDGSRPWTTSRRTLRPEAEADEARCP